MHAKNYTVQSAARQVKKLPKKYSNDLPNLTPFTYIFHDHCGEYLSCGVMKQRERRLRVPKAPRPISSTTFSKRCTILCIVFLLVCCSIAWLLKRMPYVMQTTIHQN